jgi:hypothetical protein
MENEMKRQATYRIEDNNGWIAYRGSKKACLEVLKQMIPDAAGCDLQHWEDGMWVNIKEKAVH